MSLGIGITLTTSQVRGCDQLAALARYAGTLLHEIGHMTSGTTDGSLEFESELYRLLGVTAAAALEEER
jgi:hypothetical protein